MAQDFKEVCIKSESNEYFYESSGCDLEYKQISNEENNEGNFLE